MLYPEHNTMLNQIIEKHPGLTKKELIAVAISELINAMGPDYKLDPVIPYLEQLPLTN